MESPSSVVALFLREGKNGKEVLAISRKGNLEDLGLPGGKIEPGEDPAVAVRRETREEGGVEVEEAVKVYERVDPVDNKVAWVYRIDSFKGEPSACEPNTWVGWVPFKRVLEPNCTFREYNHGLFKHLGLLGIDDELPGDWDGFAPALDLPRMADEDLKKFVFDFLGNSIFTDKHINPNGGAQVVGLVFLPLALGGLSQYNKESLSQIGCIWEYWNAALPRGINGYPMFGSMRLMHVDDWARALKGIEAEEERRKDIKI
jgi:8-oxo-dGTP pyrophosphatase MutT (NUDIX family)